MSQLRIYRDTPFDPTTLVDLNDYFTGNGILSTFTLQNKIGALLDDTVQSGINFYSRATGSVTVSGNQFTLNSPPQTGDVIIAPGVNKLRIKAYDKNIVEGDLNPRQKSYPFYVAPESVDHIVQFKYGASPGNPGIKLVWVDRDTGNGAALSWFTHSLALPNGNQGVTFTASFALYIPPIEGLSLVVTPIIIGATSVTVVDGTQYNEGDYLVFEPGTVNEEQVKCTAILGNVLTITPVGFAHATNAPLYQFGVKGWITILVPINAAGGVPVNFYEIAPKLVGSTESRI